jgi:UrcA family protein
MTYSVNSKMILGVVFAAFIFMFGFSAPALGQSPAQADNYLQTQSITVRVDGDAIAAGDPRAVQRAHNAVVRAARRVCGMAGGPRLSLRELQDARACVAETVERTVVAEGRPALTAYYGALSENRRFAVNGGPLPETVLAAVEAAAG